MESGRKRKLRLNAIAPVEGFEAGGLSQVQAYNGRCAASRGVAAVAID